MEANVEKLLRNDDKDFKTYPELNWYATVSRSASLHPEEQRFIEIRKHRISFQGANSLINFLVCPKMSGSAFKMSLSPPLAALEEDIEPCMALRGSYLHPRSSVYGTVSRGLSVSAATAGHWRHIILSPITILPDSSFLTCL